MKSISSAVLSTILVAIFCTHAVAAQSDAESKPLAVATDPVIDVGDVARGEKIRHTFSLRNDGNATLEITEVKPTCGCTVADFDERIEPGATGEIRAVVDTTNFKGPIAKAIQVFTNDSDNPRISMVVKANIKIRIDSAPGYMRFVTVFGEGDEVRQTTVWSSSRDDFIVTGVESPLPYLTAKFHEAGEGERHAAGEGRQWVVEASLAADAPPGPIADFLLVHTNHPRQEVFQIPVSGLVRPVLTVLPRLFDFGRREVSEPQVASLEIKNLGAADVVLEEIASDLAGLEAEIEPVEDGRLFKILLTLNPVMEAGPFEGVVTITTSSEKQPVLEISVRGVVL